MCMIMMEMIDFIWGKGLFKNILDVISVVKKIVEVGFRMDRFGCIIVNYCLDLVCK